MCLVTYLTLEMPKGGHIPRCHMTTELDQEAFLGEVVVSHTEKTVGFTDWGAIVPSPGALPNSSAFLSLRSTK